MKTFILVLLIVLVAGDDNKKLKDDLQDVSDTVGTAATIIGRPEIAAALETLKALKTSSSTTISERYDQAGFKKLNNVCDHGHGAVMLDKLDQLLNVWLKDSAFDNLETEHKAILSNSLMEYALQIADDAYGAQKFTLSFNNGVGKMFLLTLSMKPHPTKQGAVRWQKAFIWSEFEPAPSYVIVTHSDCNLLSCDREDVITYLPTMITDAHVQSIVNMNIGILEGIDKKQQIDLK